MSAAQPPGSMVGTRAGLHQGINPPSLEIISGAVSNASKLMKLWALDVVVCVNIGMPNKGGYRPAEEL